MARSLVFAPHADVPVQVLSALVPARAVRFLKIGRIDVILRRTAEWGGHELRRQLRAKPRHGVSRQDMNDPGLQVAAGGCETRCVQQLGYRGRLNGLRGERPARVAR